MNKFLTIITCSFALLYPLPLNAAQPSSERWQVELNPPNTNGLYSAKYSLDTRCIIWVLRDGNGLSIVAHDNNYVDANGRIWKLTETVTISPDGNKTISYGKTSGRFESFLTQGYDIFGKYYEAKAQELPPDVQKLFHGFDGVGFPSPIPKIISWYGAFIFIYYWVLLAVELCAGTMITIVSPGF
jgi:hypothetical protein